jgi:hypothetical protein
MPCRSVPFPGGGYAIVCGVCGVPKTRPRACSVCGRKTRDVKLCDFPVSAGQTCDAVLCPGCASHREPDTDYCPLHAAAVGGKLRL